MGLCCTRVPPPPAASLDLALEWPSFDRALAGRTFRAYCKRVIDGDTVVLNLDMSDVVKTADAAKAGYEFHVRINGYDSPEKKSQNETERLHAFACTTFMEHMLSNKHCLCVWDHLDNFGRLLADIYILGNVGHTQIVTQDTNQSTSVDTMHVDPQYINLSHLMLKHTPCVPYHGGHKEDWHIDTTLQSYHPAYRSIVRTTEPPARARASKRLH